MADLTNAADTTVKIVPSTLPTEGQFKGQLLYQQSTSTWYSWNGTAWVQFGSGGGGSVRRNSIWNERPVTEASSYDDEFTASALDAKWTRAVSGTTVVNGTVDPLASVTPDCVQDLSGTWPGWLLLQSDESDGQEVTYTQSWTATTDATFFMGITMILEDGAPAATNRRSTYLRLLNSGDANEWALVGWHVSTTTRLILGQVNNNGVITSDTSLDPGEFGTGMTEGIFLWKVGNTYRVGRISDTVGCKYSATVLTKTGVTTFDQIQLAFRTDPNTPSTILGVDFVRVYDSATIALKNP